jgi:hypothetical protein
VLFFLPSSPQLRGGLRRGVEIINFAFYLDEWGKWGKMEENK